ncbi:hypothetical protein CRE_19731 [Caenorhabditis remanei]|uniref:Uncharacterized protein n=1 Tax=Caenorhabditis remanei TaxID=31234 RepID=E3MTI0_CAERE|nr:hypothetical protein CRE_19731 [Caenorhabditis remanei]
MCSEYLESFCEKVESGGEDIYRFKVPDDSNKILEFRIINNRMEKKIVVEKKNF